MSVTSVTKVEFPGQTDGRGGGPPALTCPRPLHPLHELSFRDRPTDEREGQPPLAVPHPLTPFTGAAWAAPPPMGTGGSNGPLWDRVLAF